jgi:hypothetical protein
LLGNKYCPYQILFLDLFNMPNFCNFILAGYALHQQEIWSEPKRHVIWVSIPEKEIQNELAIGMLFGIPVSRAAFRLGHLARPDKCKFPR